MKTIIEKVMGPTGRLWHLAATDVNRSKDHILCGMPKEKIKPTWDREPIGWWESTGVCSNCWFSKIATEIRNESRYPPMLTTEPSIHAWRRFSDEVVDNTTTTSRAVLKFSSAKVIYFGVINDGWIERALPENPGALPVVETFGSEDGKSVIRAFIVDTLGDELVYYPLKTLIHEDEEILERYDYRLFNDDIVLSRIDNWVISGAVQSALAAPEYFVPRK